MLMQKSPNGWSCLATAFAIGLNIRVEELIRMVGHDGSEIINDLDEPYCRRSFHPQEISVVCLNHRIAVIPMERNPVSVVPKDGSVYEIQWNPIPELIHNHDGVIVGTWPNSKSHAAYLYDKIVYDPNGTTYPLDLDRVNIRTFFILRTLHDDSFTARPANSSKSGR